MTGYRVGTTGSSDRLFGAYATVGQDKVRVLNGVRVKAGTWGPSLSKSERGRTSFVRTNGSSNLGTHLKDSQDRASSPYRPRCSYAPVF